MRKYKGSKLNKILLLITALAMVLLLSGCRTRISNNTEVASTISDEEGWLQESYQMRRDELGMPVAKKPFFNGGDQEEFDDYSEEFDRDLQELDQYEYEPEDESLDDDSDDTDSGSSQTASNSSSTERNPSSATPKRKKNSTAKKKTSTEAETEAEPDPNANASTNTTPNSNTNNSPDPPQEQQGQQEQQEQPAQPKKIYTVSFDGNGVDMDGATISFEEGGRYGKLPDPPSRGDEYIFEGWFTEKDNGKEVKEGSDFTSDSDQTLYAHWTKKDPVEIWGNRYDTAANDQTDKLDCQLLPDDTGKSIVEACKGNIVSPENGPKCIIVFAPKDNVTDVRAQTIFDENAAVNPALEKVIIISDESINGNDKQKLFYKLVLLNALHGTVGQETLNAAAADLGISEYWLAIYPRP